MDQDMSQQKRPLTLRDVSEVSGVSEMTVSRVLRNRGDVSAATREKERAGGFVVDGDGDERGAREEADVAGGATDGDAATVD